MATRERPIDRGTRIGRRLLREAGGELREVRIGTGLSQADVGDALGMSHSKVGRIERAEHGAVSLMDLSVRVFPVGDPSEREFLALSADAERWLIAAASPGVQRIRTKMARASDSRSGRP